MSNISDSIGILGIVELVLLIAFIVPLIILIYFMVVLHNISAHTAETNRILRDITSHQLWRQPEEKKQ